ncbi:hypothetical protein Tco_1418725 [Tanacetum coccineum]
MTTLKKLFFFISLIETNKGSVRSLVFGKCLGCYGSLHSREFNSVVALSGNTLLILNSLCVGIGIRYVLHLDINNMFWFRPILPDFAWFCIWLRRCSALDIVWLVLSEYAALSAVVCFLSEFVVVCLNLLLSA